MVLQSFAMGVMFQSPPVFFALLICFLFGSAYSVEDIPDVDGDRDFGIQSLSVSFGQKRVSNFYNNNRKVIGYLPLSITEAAVNKLHTVGLRFCGDADLALPRLRGALPADKATRKALDELAELVSYLRVWKIDKHDHIDPLMPPTESYHMNLFFQMGSLVIWRAAFSGWVSEVQGLWSRST
ncbi:hypothetical protein POM88_049527 [Heracleum sosnowskyi]|uniref:Uncharacterized protein n=1 Tax=Heracleum sosnowskyi TaxID=360622 RepID=A0AAD8GX07_9APIA|nr:hypothetical protein POM88_049527 [Heracleum sosnowskyi]